MAVLRLKDIMTQKHVSREELAEMVEVSKTTISNITKEHNLPTIKLLLDIAKALDVDIRELFVSTKKSKVVTESEFQEAKKLIGLGLEILNKH